MIYTVTLNPAVDHIVRLPVLESGETNRAAAESIHAGGKGINVSKILKNFGEESIALGFVAGFTGLEIERILQENNKIRSDFIHLQKGFTRINTKIKADRETEINGPGPDITQADAEHFMEKISEIKHGDIVFLSGSIPSSLGDDFYAEIMKALQEKRVAIVVDTIGEALRKTLPYRPLLVKPNVRELEDFFKTAIETREDIEVYAKKMQNSGARNVIISMGGDGAYFLSEQGEASFLAAPQGKVIDTVGSGDSVVAGFVYAWKNGFSLQEAFQFGVCCGSATAFSKTLATKEEVDQLYTDLLGRENK